MNYISAFMAFWIFTCHAQAFDLQGHRGARGLAPENTLAGFQHALAVGVTTLELDVGLTADDVVVASHDTYLNPAITRKLDGEWLKNKGPLIHSLSLAQVQTFDVGRLNPDTAYGKQFATQQASDGQRIPTLASIFDMVKLSKNHSMRFNIETKINPILPNETASPDAMTRALLKVVQNAGMQNRVTVQSFDWRTLQWVHQWAPDIPTACLTIQTANTDNIKDGLWTAGLKIADHGSLPRLVKAAGCVIWSPNGSSLNEALVKEAQDLGLQVLPWTINNPTDMHRFIDWGVSGIITDYPDRLRSVMINRGLKLP